MTDGDFCNPEPTPVSQYRNVAMQLTVKFYFIENFVAIKLEATVKVM
ncbi:hypothetical protein DAMNIGENAA_33400 [Desulforhabdus amnigena]|uniref:Uncharacterized protein n=1 Tax=Desulforhabdus amnigena TaxID=40218 RepID=A0A9W6L8P9_9BACT|nr:hypothetical protein DAMNIGENAA_33400 [Desulforhabdus amnigena]